MNLLKTEMTKFVFIACLLLTSNLAWVQGTSHLYFDGVNDYVETNSEGINSMCFDFTFEAIIKGYEDEQGIDPTILSNRWSSIKGNTLYLKGNGDEPRVLCFKHGDDEYYIPGNGLYDGSLLDGECHHVAVVKYDGDIYFYADGVLFGTLIDPYYFCEYLEGWNPTWIGRDHYYDNVFHGVIGQVRMWNSARTGTEIFENMNVSLDGSEPTLTSYWELNEGEGQAVLEKATSTWIGYVGDSDESDLLDPSWYEGEYCSNAIPYGSGEDDIDDGTGNPHVSIAENEAFSTGFSVYPNPVNGNTLNIVFKDGITDASISIHTMSGQEVMQTMINAETKNIALKINELPKGVYLLKVKHSEGLSTKKVVIN